MTLKIVHNLLGCPEASNNALSFTKPDTRERISERLLVMYRIMTLYWYHRPGRPSDARPHAPIYTSSSTANLIVFLS